MSGLAGIFNRDGETVRQDWLQRMVDAAIHRGCDGFGFELDGSAGLAQLLLKATPENDSPDPVVDPVTGSVIVFDGRCDNRTEIIRKLETESVVPGGLSDAHLVLASYRAWGKDCAVQLLGDFAFAVWDVRKRGLFCVRDVMGVNPFYYFHGPACFAFASEVGQLLQHPLVPCEANEGMVAEILGGEVFSREETIYRDIQRLPPAHWLWVDGEGLVKRRYWALEPGSRVQHRTRSEYEEHFREHLTRAISCRLRRQGELGIRLSGGRDSPAIAGLAQSLLAREHPPHRLRSYSLYFPGLPCDESKQIGAVVDFSGLQHFSHDFAGFPEPPGWFAEVSKTRDLPFYPTMTAMNFLFDRAVNDGVRVSLAGLGAYRSLGGTSYPYLSYLRDFRLLALLREWQWQTRCVGAKSTTRALIRNLGWPVLPAFLQRQLSGRRNDTLHSGFLESGFVSQVNLAGRAEQANDAHRFSDLAQWPFYRRLSSGDQVYNHEMQNRYSASREIDDRHPFLDRRLVEFAFAIPDWLHHDRQRLKPLLLDGAREWVPKSVRSTPGYGELSCLYLAAMRLAEFRDAMESSCIAREGWVNGKDVRAEYHRLMNSVEPGRGARPEDMRVMYELWWVFAVETWYRTL